MCLAVPFKIVAIEGETATIDAEGVRMPVCLLLIINGVVGFREEYQAGNAIAALIRKTGARRHRPPSHRQHLPFIGPSLFMKKGQMFNNRRYSKASK